MINAEYPIPFQEAVRGQLKERVNGRAHLLVNSDFLDNLFLPDAFI